MIAGLKFVFASKFASFKCSRAALRISSMMNASEATAHKPADEYCWIEFQDRYDLYRDFNI